MLTTKYTMQTTKDRLRDTIAPRWSRTRITIQDEVAPAVTSAIRTAKESSAPARAEALDRATVAYRALRGEQPKARRWPLAIGFFAIGAGAGMIAAALSRRPQTPSDIAQPTRIGAERTPQTEPVPAYAP